jgi:hypothetical protein
MVCAISTIIEDQHDAGTEERRRAQDLAVD